MQKIVIIGNSISADIMYAYLKKDERYHVVAFAVDREFIKEKNKFELPVVELNKLSTMYSTLEHKIILAVGYNKINKVRAEIFNRIRDMGYVMETYIHPKAQIYTDIKIGDGSVILGGSIIEPYATIGENSIIWANCVIGHHSKVGNNCWIASGTVVAGEATVGNNSFLGVNATVSNQVNVGAFNIVGGNTAIHRNTKDNEVYLSSHGEKHRFSATDYDQYYLK